MPYAALSNKVTIKEITAQRQKDVPNGKYNIVKSLNIRV